MECMFNTIQLIRRHLGENNRCPQNAGMTDAIRYAIRDMHNYRRSVSLVSTTALISVDTHTQLWFYRKVLADGQITDKSGVTLPRGANIMKLARSFSHTITLKSHE